MWDDDGNQVYEPEEARRFFAEPANLMVSIVDDGDNNGIRLYLGKSTDISDVMNLDQTLRVTATKYNMIYNVRRYGRNLKPSDFSSKASVKEDKGVRNMDKSTFNLLEGMYGTTRSSYLKLENARMIVRHSKKIDEMITGSRARNIDSIFVENAQGERFLFPTTQLAGGRAMTQHVNHGGSFADTVGQQIINMASAYANLGSASNFISSNISALAESAGSIREKCRCKMHETRKCFERLSRSGGYLNEAKRLEEAATTLVEGETSVDITEVQQVLALEGFDLSESVLTCVAEAIKSFEEREVSMDEGVRSKSEEGDDKCPECHGKGFIGGRRSPDGAGWIGGETCPACGGNGIESTSVVGRNVSTAAWNEFKAGKLPMFNHPKIRPDSMPGFRTNDAMLSFVLGQIVPEVKNSSMSSFLGYVAGELQNESLPESRRKSLKTVATHAIQLAKVIDVPMPKNETVREFAEWINSFRPSAILAETDDDMMSDRFPGSRDPESFAAGAHGDAMEDASEEVVNEFDPEDFLKSHGPDFNWGDAGLSGEELNFDKAYILSSLSHYLSKKVEDQFGFTDVDMDAEANELFDKVAPLLTDAGYQLSEDAFGRSDMVIQTNQGASLAREVTKPVSIDPYNGDEVPTDTDYVTRMRQLAGMPWNR